MESIKIRYSKTRTMIHWCAIFAAILHIVVQLFLMVRSQHTGERIVLVLIISILLAIGICIFKINKKPALELSDEGFKIFALSKPIPWKEIAEVEKGKKVFINIKLTNSEEVLKRRRDLRFFRFCYRPDNEYDLAITIFGLSLSRDKVFELVSERINK